MESSTPDTVERPTKSVTPDIPEKRVEIIDATALQSAEWREMHSLLNPQNASSTESISRDPDAQSDQSTRMFEKLPTIEGFNVSDRDTSVMEGLREWHERSLKSGRAIDVPSANDVASIL